MINVSKKYKKSKVAMNNKEKDDKKSEGINNEVKKYKRISNNSRMQHKIFCALDEMLMGTLEVSDRDFQVSEDVLKIIYKEKKAIPVELVIITAVVVKVFIENNPDIVFRFTQKEILVALYQEVGPMIKIDKPRRIMMKEYIKYLTNQQQDSGIITALMYFCDDVANDNGIGVN